MDRQPLKDQIEEACRVHDIRDVLHLATNRAEVSMLCPLPDHVHHNRTPSFSIFWKEGKQYWKCHGQCRKDGDVVDLVGELTIRGYNKRDYRHVCRALGELDSRYAFRAVIPPASAHTPALDPQLWRAYLPAGLEVVAYAASRGLREETLSKFNVGQHTDAQGRIWMTLPCFHEGRLVGIKKRRCATVASGRYMQEKGSRQGLFNFDAVYLTTRPVLIVKAEIPVMLLDQLGYLATAPTGGEGGWREDWRTALALAPKVLIGDNDRPGRILGQKRAALMGAGLHFPPEPYKDVDEWILAERTNALKAIDSWIEAAERAR